MATPGTATGSLRSGSSKFGKLRTDQAPSEALRRANGLNGAVACGNHRHRRDREAIPFGDHTGSGGRTMRSSFLTENSLIDNDMEKLREKMAALGQGITIDDFLKDTEVPPADAELFTDQKIKEELTDRDGQSVRYSSLLQSLGYIVTSMYGMVPEVDNNHKMVDDLKELKALSDRVFHENKLLVVAGFAAKSTADQNLRSRYEAVYESSRDRIKRYAMDYFGKIEELSDKDLIIRQGFVGRLGDLISGFTSQKFRYRNGETPKMGTHAYDVFRAANSPWLLSDELNDGKNVINHNLNYCSNVDEFLVLKGGVPKKWGV